MQTPRKEELLVNLDNAAATQDQRDKLNIRRLFDEYLSTYANNNFHSCDNKPFTLKARSLALSSLSVLALQKKLLSETCLSEHN